jgi:hypothetical protein
LGFLLLFQSKNLSSYYHFTSWIMCLKLFWTKSRGWNHSLVLQSIIPNDTIFSYCHWQNGHKWDKICQRCYFRKRLHVFFAHNFFSIQLNFLFYFLKIVIKMHIIVYINGMLFCLYFRINMKIWKCVNSV